MEKVRNSNMELLRLLAMFMVLVYHADFLSLGVPKMDFAMNASQWIDSSLRFLIQSACVVCVNVFVMLSGWFGIRPKLDRLISFLFQVTFFTIVGIFVNVMLGGRHLCFDDLKNLFMLNDNLWFPKSYLLLYLFSPVLNAFVERTSKRHFRILLIGIIAFQMVYGWLSRGVAWYMGGYSCIFFMELYLLARYVRLHVDYLHYSKKFIILSYAICCVVIACIWMCLMAKNIDVTRFLNVYTQPFAILGALLLLMLFSKFNYQSKKINKIAGSCFAVYLFHCAPNMLQHFSYAIANLHDESNLFMFIFYALLLIVAVYSVAILLDQVRIWIWNMVHQSSIYLKSINKCQTYL